MKWRIEEANTGSTSETGLIVVYPDMIVDDLSACCQAMYTDTMKKMYVLVDTRTSVSQTESFLGAVSASMPDLEIVTRFAHPFVLSLVLHLWREMRRYCEGPEIAWKNFVETAFILDIDQLIIMMVRFHCAIAIRQLLWL